MHFTKTVVVVLLSVTTTAFAYQYDDLYERGLEDHLQRREEILEAREAYVEALEAQLWARAPRVSTRLNRR